MGTSSVLSPSPDETSEQTLAFCSDYPLPFDKATCRLKNRKRFNNFFWSARSRLTCRDAKPLPGDGGFAWSREEPRRLLFDLDGREEQGLLSLDQQSDHKPLFRFTDGLAEFSHGTDFPTINFQELVANPEIGPGRRAVRIETFD